MKSGLIYTLTVYRIQIRSKINMDISVLMSKLRQFLRVFVDYPGLDIVIAIVIIFYVLWTMRERQSSSGVWFLLVIAILFFMFGLGGITGLGFGMSF